MEGHFVHELALAAEAQRVYAEDFADRLSSRYTSIGLLTLAAVAVTRQYVFKPIQCWVPGEWPRPWEEFAENYCWTQGTYRVSLTDAAHPAVQVRGKLAINYFQWVPILLLAQAALVMAPHQLWRMASRHLSGRDPHTVVRFAVEAERAGRPSVRKRLLAYTAWQLEGGTRLADAGTAAAAGRSRPGCSEAMRQSGCVLFVAYLVSKVAHLLSAVGQVLILQRFLGLSSPLFGWHIARGLLNSGDQHWQQAGVFPRVTFCDIPLRHVGQWNLRSVQCVLAANMVYEKIFVFLWFWFAFCCLATALYAACWLAELLPASGRRRVVRSHLRLLPRSPTGEGEGEGEGELKTESESEGESDGEGEEKFDDNGEGESEGEAVRRAVLRLRLDGVFLLQMIADNADCLCAAQVLGRLMRRPRRRWQPFGPASSV